VNAKIIKHVILSVALALLLPLVAHSQDFQRVSFGADATAWFAPDLDGFSMALGGPGVAEIHEIDDTALFGLRPFVRFGLLQGLDLELSHEFAFSGDTDIMVSSASGIWRPFGQSGLELHASICYGQFDWDGPGNFDSNWGWEIGAGYNLRLLQSASLIFGVAYRDLTFDFEIDEMLQDFTTTRPDVSDVLLTDTEVDAAGVVASAGVLITF
jgi:hypothetical protein